MANVVAIVAVHSLVCPFSLRCTSVTSGPARVQAVPKRVPGPCLSAPDTQYRARVHARKVLGRSRKASNSLGSQKRWLWSTCPRRESAGAWGVRGGEVVGVTDPEMRVLLAGGGWRNEGRAWQTVPRSLDLTPRSK